MAVRFVAILIARSRAMQIHGSHVPTDSRRFPRLERRDDASLAIDGLFLRLESREPCVDQWLPRFPATRGLALLGVGPEAVHERRIVAVVRGHESVHREQLAIAKLNTLNLIIRISPSRHAPSIIALESDARRNAQERRRPLVLNCERSRASRRKA